MSSKRLLMTLIDRAVEVMDDGARLDWNSQLKKIDDKIQLVEEQIRAQPETPPETPADTAQSTEVDAQNDTRYQLHSLEFEKTTLEGSLDSAAAALATTKGALDRETRRRTTLENRLIELENRLLETLGM